MTDWPEIIIDIKRILGTETAIAERTGMSLSSINGLLCGRTREPVHSSGERLLNLHKRLCKAGPFDEILDRIRMGQNLAVVVEKRI